VHTRGLHPILNFESRRTFVRLSWFSFLMMGNLAALGGTLRAETIVPALPELPAALNSPNLKPYLAVSAKGVQIYVCSRVESGKWTWAFKAPEADLLDATGTLLGKHYAGPSWEGRDQTKVVGSVKASASAPDANAIDWLRLDVRSREGTGAFAQAASILRVSTSGGKAPPSGCDEARVGSELRVPYTATYYFLK
jgi:hypothetical protein